MPEDILNVALVQEKKAYEFYAEVYAHSNVGVVRELVEKLKDEEYKHIQLIEGMLRRLKLG